MLLGFEGGIPNSFVVAVIWHFSTFGIAHRFNRPGSGGGDDVREDDLFVVGTGSQSIRCVQFHFWAGQNDAGVGFFGCDREEGTRLKLNSEVK